MFVQKLIDIEVEFMKKHRFLILYSDLETSNTYSTINMNTDYSLGFLDDWCQKEIYCHFLVRQELSSLDSTIVIIIVFHCQFDQSILLLHYNQMFYGTYELFMQVFINSSLF